MSIRVSIYEDKRDLRQSLETLLKFTQGVELVGSSPNCLTVDRDVLSTKPDVILMDIDMPGRTGIEGARIVKEKFPHINVMMLTVFDDNDNIFNALKAGATGYLIKSSISEKIIDSIFEIHDGGSPISSNIARKILTELSGPKQKDKSESILTAREDEVLRLMEQGNGRKAVADKLNVSYHTIRTHIRNIYEKLQASSSSDAVYKAKKQGWL